MKLILMKFVLIVLLAALGGCSDLLTAPEENENNRACTTISFGLTEPNHVLLYVTNYNFELVKVLANEEMPNGPHSIIWDGKDYNGDAIASGIYYYFLIAGDYASGQQMILVK
jgi:flagellar hook assembly protein FlgD